MLFVWHDLVPLGVLRVSSWFMEQWYLGSPRRGYIVKWRRRASSLALQRLPWWM